MNIYISAIIHIKENAIIDAIELLKRLVIETRKEKGCIQYDLYEDHRTKGVFFIHEIWESSEDLHHHQISDHMLQFRDAVQPYLENPNKVYVGNKLF